MGQCLDAETSVSLGELSESFRHGRHLRHAPLNFAARCRPHLVNQRNIIEDLGAAIRIESKQLRDEMCTTAEATSRMASW